MPAAFRTVAPAIPETTKARGNSGGATACANTHDRRLGEATLESVPVERPDAKEVEQNLCMDQGYHNADVGQTMAEYGYRGPINSRPIKPPRGRRSPGIVPGVGGANGRMRGGTASGG